MVVGGKGQWEMDDIPTGVWEFRCHGQQGWNWGALLTSTLILPNCLKYFATLSQIFCNICLHFLDPSLSGGINQTKTLSSNSPDWNCLRSEQGSKFTILGLSFIFPHPRWCLEMFPLGLLHKARWDAQPHICLHRYHLSALLGWVLSICGNLIPSVQPPPADSQWRSCKKRWNKITASSTPSSPLGCSFSCWSSPSPAVAAAEPPQSAWCLLWRCVTCFSLFLNALPKK